MERKKLEIRQDGWIMRIKRKRSQKMYALQIQYTMRYTDLIIVDGRGKLIQLVFQLGNLHASAFYEDAMLRYNLAISRNTVLSYIRKPGN